MGQEKNMLKPLAKGERVVPAYLSLVSTPPLAFFFLCIYTALAFLRLHEYGGALVDIPILPVLIGFTFVLWLAVERKNFSAPQFVIVLGLLFALTFSYAGATRWVGGTVKAFLDFSTIVLYFVLVATTVNTPKRMGVFLSVLANCLFVVAIHCIFQAQSGIGWTGALLSQGTRATYIGFLSDPNDLALALLAVLPITVGWIFRKGGFVRKPLGLLYSVAYLYVVYLTNSRGAVVALGFMMLVLSVVKLRSVKSLIVLPILFISLVAFAPSRVAEIDSKEESAAERVDAWYAGYQMFRRSPIFGVGQNRFQENHDITAHNSFVQVMAELGFFGLFFWVAMLAVTIIMLIRAVKAHRLILKSNQASVNMLLFQQSMPHMYTVMSALAGTLAASMFLSRAYVIMLYVLIGLVVANFSMLKTAFPGLAMPTFRALWPRFLLIQALGIFAMWLVTKILLR
jgi:putative inorganic carbon (hco3(-)) transporter